MIQLCLDVRHSTQLRTRRSPQYHRMALLISLVSISIIENSDAKISMSYNIENFDSKTPITSRVSILPSKLLTAMFQLWHTRHCVSVLNATSHIRFERKSALAPITRWGDINSSIDQSHNQTPGILSRWARAFR